MNPTPTPTALPPGFWENSTIPAPRAKAIIRAYLGIPALKGSNAIAAHDHTRARTFLDELEGFTVCWAAVLDPTKNLSFAGTAHYTIHEILRATWQDGQVTVPADDQEMYSVGLGDEVPNPSQTPAAVIAQPEQTSMEDRKSRSEIPLTDASLGENDSGSKDKNETTGMTDSNTPNSPHSSHMDVDASFTHHDDTDLQPGGEPLPNDEGGDDELFDECSSIHVVASMLNTGAGSTDVHIVTTGTFLVERAKGESHYAVSAGDVLDHLLSSNILDAEHYPFKLFHVEDDGDETVWRFLASVPTPNFEDALFAKPAPFVPVTSRKGRMEIRVKLRHVRQHPELPPTAVPILGSIPAAAPPLEGEKAIRPKGKPQKEKPVKNTFSPEEKHQSHLDWLEAMYGRESVVGSVQHGDGLLLWEEWVKLSTIVGEAEKAWETGGKDCLTFYSADSGERVENKAFGTLLRGPALMAWLNKGDTWIGQLRRGYKLIKDLTEDELEEVEDVNQSYDRNDQPLRTGALTWLQGMERFLAMRNGNEK
ncbi:hypothetical protein FRC04_007819 [Tulasnella sp. 424]|nr:hypothetical protein FRC04_007819 [Tulasnella sp. 424]